MRLAFGECVLDTDRRVLLRASAPVHLTPKAFRLLELLAAERPRVFSKEEIAATLWPGVFVSGGSLANLAVEIRTAIGDDARQPRFLRTVTRFGYAFSGDAVELPEPALSLVSRPPYRLLAPQGETALACGEWVIGRASECAVCLDSSTVSRHHARLRITADETVLEDLGSKNGTWLRGERLTAPVALVDGDVILFGSVRVSFRVASPQSTTASLQIEPES